MFETIKKKILAANIVAFDVLAPRAAEAALPGQFVTIIADQYAERVPLTITNYNREKGIVQAVIQALGPSTQKINLSNEGDSFHSLVGLLGQASEFVHMDLEDLKKEKYLFVGGGPGVAPVYPQVKRLHDHGVISRVIIGNKPKDLVILEEEMRRVAEKVYIATDDGSQGFKGLVTDCLEDLVKKGNHYDHCVAIGPIVMMRYVSLLTKKLGIPTTVSLNPIVVDGTGMCDACRCAVAGKTKFACIHGPEFDGHQIDSDEVMKRQAQYTDVEKLRGVDGYG